MNIIITEVNCLFQDFLALDESHSLRVFAKTLDMNQGILSSLLRGQRPLSKSDFSKFRDYAISIWDSEKVKRFEYIYFKEVYEMELMKKFSTYIFKEKTKFFFNNSLEKIENEDMSLFNDLFSKLRNTMSEDRYINITNADRNVVENSFKNLIHKENSEIFANFLMARISEESLSDVKIIFKNFWHGLAQFIQDHCEDEENGRYFLDMGFTGTYQDLKRSISRNNT